MSDVPYDEHQLPFHFDGIIAVCPYRNCNFSTSAARPAPDGFRVDPDTLKGEVAHKMLVHITRAHPGKPRWRDRRRVNHAMGVLRRSVDRIAAADLDGLPETTEPARKDHP